MRQHEVLFTDQSFRISNPRSDAYGYCIEHRCRTLGGEWLCYIWGVVFRGDLCGWCGNRPSEGLQAVFWFLKDDSS